MTDVLAYFPDLKITTSPRYRVDKLIAEKYNLSVHIKISDDTGSFFELVVGSEILKGYSKKNNTFYYGVKDVEPETFNKHGHILAPIFNQIVDTDNSVFAHGACIGVNGNGALICASGQRGKSTLTVLSLLKGFDFVSDDYLILKNENDKIYTYPIYSMYTLSYRMYNEMYDLLDGTKFISNNGRNDKYLINIANRHSQFRSGYPVSVCLLPEIDTKLASPTITKCSQQEKGSAITQMVYSTIVQMGDTGITSKVLKMVNMLKGYDFYKIELCPDIYKNVEYLNDFLKGVEL